MQALIENNLNTINEKIFQSKGAKLIYLTFTAITLEQILKPIPRICEKMLTAMLSVTSPAHVSKYLLIPSNLTIQLIY